MNISSETRLDKSKVTHIKIKDKFNGIDTGWGVKKYKYCKATYYKLFGYKWLKAEEGYWRDGKQISSCLSPMYDAEQVASEPKYMTKDGWVYTKASVKVFVGDKLIKTLFFLEIETAIKYCDNNFNNINFII